MNSPRLQAAGRLVWLGYACLAGVVLFASACGRSTPTTAVQPATAAEADGTPSADVIEPTGTATTGEAPIGTDWIVEIVQAGAVLPEANSAVQAARAPFTLRVRLPAPAPIKLNTFTTDQNFQALQPGFVFTEDCLLALCTGMDVAEERQNPGQTLFVDVELTHYLYYQAPDDHRWSRVDLSGAEAVLERDVAALNDTPIEQTADAALYLLLYLDQGNPQQIDPGELKKLVLLFQ